MAEFSVKKSAGNGTQVGHDTSWSNANNVAGSDDAYTDSDLQHSSPSTTLEPYNYDFQLPSNAIVRGFEVHIERWAEDTEIRDLLVRLEINGVISSTTHEDTGTDWPVGEGSQAIANYGGSNDLWGYSASQVTPDKVNDNSLPNNDGFNVHIRAQNTDTGGPAATAFIDNVEVTVHYDLRRPFFEGVF